jgi:hypothetical protein
MPSMPKGVRPRKSGSAIVLLAFQSASAVAPRPPETASDRVAVPEPLEKALADGVRELRGAGDRVADRVAVRPHAPGDHRCPVIPLQVAGEERGAGAAATAAGAIRHARGARRHVARQVIHLADLHAGGRDDAKLIRVPGDPDFGQAAVRIREDGLREGRVQKPVAISRSRRERPRVIDGDLGTDLSGALEEHRLGAQGAEDGHRCASRSHPKAKEVSEFC